MTALADFLFEFDVPFQPGMIDLFEKYNPDQGDFGFDLPKVNARRGIVKREFARDISQVPTADTLDTRVGLPFPNFSEYQPKCAAFACANENNMAATLIFVVVSQGVSWPNLVEWFPDIMQWIRRPTDMNGNRKVGIGFFPKTVPWSQAVLWGRESVDFIWRHRGPIYGAIMQSMQDDAQAGGTGFMVYKKLLSIPGLGIPKAGFAAQLIIGKMGCIDSVNMLVHGAPKKLVNPKGGFVNPKGWFKVPPTAPQGEAQLMRILHGDMNKNGEKLAKLYVSYLDKLKRDGQDSACSQLWTDWCELIAYKIWHGGTPQKAIDVNFGTTQSRVLAYSGTRDGEEDPNQIEMGLGDEREERTMNARAANLEKAKKELRKHARTGPDDKLSPAGTGHIIGKQHHDLVTASLAKEIINNLLEARVSYVGDCTDSFDRNGVCTNGLFKDATDFSAQEE